ncbi:MAG: hypothetical protein ISS82_01905 [Nanoarchaeota archaeon]|nr:hypothetical protein [Nanoarchaeota archaeon]
MRGFLISLFVFLLMVNIVLGANIHGSIYDLSLNKMGNVVVEINTAPKQFYVSKNGTYSFTVPIGSYKVKAQHYGSGLLVSSTSENITVKNAGDYILDLVLFPIINEEELLEDELKIQKGNLYRNNFIVFLVIILVVLSILFYFYNKKKAVKEDKLKKVVEEEKEVAESDFYGEGILDKVIEIIKEEGGRTTQKDIRKKIPLSEAKISLVIAELEANDKIRKIKKGRGNIIILK